jgi:hypothetical protein
MLQLTSKISPMVVYITTTEKVLFIKVLVGTASPTNQNMFCFRL